MTNDRVTANRQAIPIQSLDGLDNSQSSGEVYPFTFRETEHGIRTGIVEHVVQPIANLFYTEALQIGAAAQAGMG
jgi:hypothetical protein